MGITLVVLWALGRVEATGVGPADLRAPSPDIARVAAERTARKAARARLESEARALPWAGGGTVGARADAALAAAATDEVRYQSDGSVVVRMHLDLDALAGAASADGAVVAVDARRLPLAPAVGLALAGAATRYEGPVRYVREAPPGARVVAATGAEGATLAVPDLAPARSPVYILYK
jgi:hypothetical protein